MEKKYQYYLFSFKKEYDAYSKNSTRLYAYCSEKNLKNEFKETRNMKLFDIEKVKLSKYQIHHLTSEYQNLRLLEYRFSDDFEFPITMDEKLTIEYIGNQIISSELYIKAFDINPNIFNEENFNLLKEINYVDCFYYLVNGGDSEFIYNIYPDFLRIFIKTFGKTLDFKEML